MLSTLLLVLCLSTPLITARKGIEPGEQEWGYVEVRPGSHMFWWLYYASIASDPPTSKPLIIWLQGGPGAGATGWGNFMEVGPVDINLQPRNLTWVKEYNVLFVDSPVGSGFSYVNEDGSFSTTNAGAAQDLIELMRGFYKTLPHFKTAPIYIVGESYGGKIAAEFALELYKAEKAGEIESNLKGVALGDAWISPIDSVMTWAPYLLDTGMIDSQGFKQIVKSALRTNNAIENKKWQEAVNLWGNTEAVIRSNSPNIDFYNILKRVQLNPGIDEEEEALIKFLNSKIKDALGLKVDWGDQSDEVFSSMSGEFMKPVTHIVEQLLNNTNLRVIVFNGQLDLIVDTPGTLKWVENLQWKYSKLWNVMPREPITIDGYIEGFVKEHDNFAFYWFNRAGHMVPTDNPKAALAMLRRFTKDEDMIDEDSIILVKQ